MATLESLEAHVYLLIDTSSKQYDSPDDVRSITLFVNGVSSTFTASLPTTDITLALVREHELLQCIEMAEGDALNACDLPDVQRSSVVTLLHAYRACYFQLSVTPSDITIFFRLVAEAAMALDEHEPADLVVEELATFVQETFPASAVGLPESPTGTFAPPRTGSTAAPDPLQAPTRRGSPARATFVAGMRVPSARPSKRNADRKASKPNVKPAAHAITPSFDDGDLSTPALDSDTVTHLPVPAPTILAPTTVHADAPAATIFGPSAVGAVCTINTPPSVDVLPAMDTSPDYSVPAPGVVHAAMPAADAHAPITDARDSLGHAPTPAPAIAAPGVPAADLGALASSYAIATSAPEVQGGNVSAHTNFALPGSSVVAGGAASPIQSTSVMVERTIGSGRRPQASVCSDDDEYRSDDTCPSLRTVADSSDSDDEDDGNEAMPFVALMALLEAYLMEHRAARREARRGQ